MLFVPLVCWSGASQKLSDIERGKLGGWVSEHRRYLAAADSWPGTLVLAKAIVETKLADIQQFMTRPGIQYLCRMQLRKFPFQCRKRLSV